MRTSKASKTSYDWFYIPSDDKRSLKFEEVLPGSGRPSLADKSIYLEAVMTSRGNRKVFKEVGGKNSYAYLALQDPSPAAMDRLIPHVQKTNVRELPERGATKLFGASQEALKKAQSTEIHRFIKDHQQDLHDNRVGLASLVPHESSNGAVDLLQWPESKGSVDIGRVVGELVETHALLRLHKPNVSSSLLDKARDLKHLLGDSGEVEFTWMSHLTRTLERNPRQWAQHLEAIDLSLQLWGELNSRGRAT